MRRSFASSILAIAMLSALAQPARADALDGALEGALWGGIIGGGDGAVAGALIGGAYGASREDRRRRHYRAAERRRYDYERAQWEQHRQMQQQQYEMQRRQAWHQQQMQMQRQQAWQQQPLQMQSRQSPAQPSGAGLRVDATLITETQKTLVRLGYDPGSVDGRLGARTAEAIKAYQRDKSLLESGQPSQALLKHMLSHGG